MATDELYPCSSCGFLIHDEPPGSYIICDICNWEDDQVQLANPSSAGGANKISLAESQSSILEKYPMSIKEVDGIKRDPNWRPLTDQEIKMHADEVKTQKNRWTRRGISDIESCYWFKK